MSDQREAVIARLKSVAARRQKAEMRVDTYRDETDALIVAGYGEGLPKQQLAEAAGLTRQTVYTVLRKAGVDA